MPAARENADSSRPVGSMRPGTPRRVLITAVIGAVLGLVSIAFCLSIVWNLRLVWLAVIGLAFGGAAWVMAALVGSRKRWGMLAVLVCLVGIVAPLVVTAAVVKEARGLAQAQGSQQADSTYEQSAAASTLGAAVNDAAALGSSQLVEEQAVEITAVSFGDAARKELAEPVPKPDGQYVAARVDVSNTADDAQDPALTLGFDLVTPGGDTYDATSCPATTTKPLLDVGSLSNGRSASVVVCFDVPAKLNKDTLSTSAIRVSDANDPEHPSAFWATAD